MTKASQSKPNILRGRRILVVEDEYMIAAEVAEMLVQAGAEPLGPVPRVAAAMTLLDREGRVDAALLDVNLSNESIWPVVDRLLALDVPLVLATGYDASAIPSAYAHLPRCEKPTSGADLSQALQRVLARSPLPS